MARLLFLDSGPLNLALTEPGGRSGDQLRAWLDRIESAGVWIYLPEIVDYEVRRECLRSRAGERVRRLNALKRQFVYLSLSTAVMLRAAELWAEVRQRGMPTADDRAIDADCILAAQVLTATGSGDVATVATTNVRHLARFPGIVAQEWAAIAP